MKLASTNNYTDAASSFSVTSDADGDEDINDILTPDFSSSYTSAGTVGSFTFTRTFTTPFNAKYVGVAGHNLDSIGGNLTLKINGSTIETVPHSTAGQNFPVFFLFDEVSVTTIEITFAKSSSANKATISYVAAGSLLSDEFTFPIQNQPEGGFPVNHRTRNKKIRTALNDDATPVAYIRESVVRNVVLNLNNISRNVLGTFNWLYFQDLVYETGAFFIMLEDGEDFSNYDPRSGMLGFNVEIMPPKIHSLTRELVNLQIKYSVYVGV